MGKAARLFHTTSEAMKRLHGYSPRMKERPSLITSSGVDEALAGSGPTPPESGRSLVPLFYRVTG